MNYGSVCSGIEAASVAWEPLGWKPAWFSEIEPFPSAVLAHRFPTVPNLGDMLKIHEKEQFNGTNLDVLVGGTPCQAFSLAGLRKGLDDPRGNLTLTFLGLVEKRKPRWVLWENVPGVLSIDDGRIFGTFLGALAQLGYGWAYRVLDAQWFGVPQRRRRVFVVGYLGDQRAAAGVLFERQGLRRDPPPSREKRKDLAPTLSARTKGGGGLGTDFDLDGGLVAKTLLAKRNSSMAADLETYIPTKEPTAIPLDLRNAGRDPEKKDEMNRQGLGVGKEGDPSGTVTSAFVPGVAVFGGNRTGGELDAAPALNAKGGSGRMDFETEALIVNDAPGFQRSQLRQSDKLEMLDVAPTLKAECKKGDTELNVLTFKIRQGKPGGGKGYLGQEDKAFTVATHQDQNLFTGSAVRRLTPVECARLQGFPDNWTQIPWRGKPVELCPDGPQYKAYGNSMAVPVMRWIGQRIDAVEQILKEQRT